MKTVEKDRINPHFVNMQDQRSKVMDLAYQLFPTKEEAENWFASPAELFSGQSPEQVILRGNGRSLIALMNIIKLRERVKHL